jgi:hypothetical protein
MVPDQLFELRSATYKARTTYQQAMLDYILAMRQQRPPEHLCQSRQACREAAAFCVSRLCRLRSYLMAHADVEQQDEVLRQIAQTTELIAQELAALDSER